MTPHLRWTPGGEARIVRMAGDAIVLRSTVSSPPGSRIEGVLLDGPAMTLRIKVHACRRQADGDFVIEGRPLDLTRAMRARLECRVHET